MTLVVVTPTEILVDSFESNGSLEFNIGSAKVRTHRSIPGKFIVAGCVSDMSIITGNCTTKEELLSASFPCDSADHSVVSWIVEGDLWVLECSKGARWFRLERVAPICYQAGAGWHWFEAFYKDKGNVDDAFQRTCELHPQCALPVNKVRIEDQV